MARRGWNEEGLPTVLLDNSDGSLIALIYRPDTTVAVSTFNAESEAAFKQLDVVDVDEFLVEAAEKVLSEDYGNVEEFIVLATRRYLLKGMPSLKA
jgi:hypothetical protein